MKQSMYKNKEELPMFLTVMDVAGLLGISLQVPMSLCVRTISPSSRSFRDEPSSHVTGSSSGSTSKRDMTARKEANATISERMRQKVQARTEHSVS